MVQNLVVNLPVKDLARSIEFFTKLGYRFEARFSNDVSACLIINEQCFVMLLTEPFFQTFTPKAIVDAKGATEVLVALSLESREAVDQLVDLACACGGRVYREPQDHDFMYAWGFEDLDGHIWEAFWMNQQHGA